MYAGIQRKAKDTFIPTYHYNAVVCGMKATKADILRTFIKGYQNGTYRLIWVVAKYSKQRYR